MNTTKIFAKLFGILLIVSVLLPLSSCASHKGSTYKGKGNKYAYHKIRTKQPNWNTTTSLQTNYIIKNKRRTRFHY